MCSVANSKGVSTVSKEEYLTATGPPRHGPPLLSPGSGESHVLVFLKNLHHPVIHSSQYFPVFVFCSNRIIQMQSLASNSLGSSSDLFMLPRIANFVQVHCWNSAIVWLYHWPQSHFTVDGCLIVSTLGQLQTVLLAAILSVLHTNIISLVFEGLSLPSENAAERILWLYTLARAWGCQDFYFCQSRDIKLFYFTFSYLVIRLRTSSYVY